LAGRVYKTTFVGLGGAALAFAAPAMVSGFIAKVRSVMTQRDAHGFVADFVLRDRLPDEARVAGLVLAATFLALTVIAVVVVWIKGR